MASQSLKNVSNNLRSVTQSLKGGVPFERLQKDYKDLLGEPIPYRELGYNTLEAFIRGIPDVITLKRNNEGQLMALAVADSSTAHIASLISRQKSDTRKKPIKKFTPRFGSRSFSSRYSYREGARGSHSSYSSPPRAISRSSKPKPPSKPPAPPVQHSKPRAPIEQVPSSRKYEVAPRFMKLKEGQNSSAEVSSSTITQTVPSTTRPSLLPIPSTTRPSLLPIPSTTRPSLLPIPSPTRPSPPAIPSPTAAAPSEQVEWKILSPTSPPKPKSSFSFDVDDVDDSEVIPPPRAVCRSVPIKPQPLEISRSQQFDALKYARSAKEFVEIYAKMNNTQPIYRTVLLGQKTKSKGYVSTLTLNGKKYQTYPILSLTEELAEEEAAGKAMAELKARKGNYDDLRGKTGNISVMGDDNHYGDFDYRGQNDYYNRGFDYRGQKDYYNGGFDYRGQNDYYKGEFDDRGQNDYYKGDFDYRGQNDYYRSRGERDFDSRSSERKYNFRSSAKEEDLNALPETPYSNAEEIRILLNRIEEIVCEKPSGMFDNGIVREFEQKYNEKLPSCWPELLKQSVSIEIEELRVTCGKKPEGVNFIARKTKEASSGNATPSSTSSKAESFFRDLDSTSLKQSLVHISLPKVPEIKLPSGNFWEVFITDVTDSLSARFVGCDDDFRNLSDDMDQFYNSRTLPVTEVFVRQLYAACTDDNPNIWHRVIVDEILEDEQVACYFVDNGDISLVPIANMQEMCPRFLELPYQAIHLALEDLEEYENCIRSDILESFLLGKTLIAEVKRMYPIPEFFPDLSGIDRTVYYVVLFDTSDPSGDINLNDLLKKAAMESTLESLDCKLPKLATTSRAYLSHVTPEGHVYLRMTNPQECWIELEMDRLSQVFDEVAAPGHKVPLNTMCAAKYESGTWHRAIVSESLTSVDPELVEVFFVDHGHVGFVGKSEICELKPINEFLASAPVQAICCELANALPSPNSRWTELATEKLLQLAPCDQELLIRVVSEKDETNLAKVNLCKRNEDSNIISINESLSCNPTLFYEEPSTAAIKVPTALPLRQNSRKNSIRSNLSGIIPDVAVPAEEQMARRLGTSLSSEKIEWLTTPDNIKSPEAFEVQSPVSLELPDVPKMGLFNVFVTMACHPHNFIVQPLDSCIDLDNVMEEMQSFYSSEDNLLEMDFSMLRKNDYYAALHSDGRWYRARIEEIVSGSPVLAVVNYVDFGDFSTVAIGRLQPLYQKFKILPSQAIKASLSGIQPMGSDWNPVHCVSFKEIVTEKRFVSFIQNKRTEVKDNIPSLHLELVLVDTNSPDKDVYIHELLIARNYARAK